jgi:hypothetical protein
MSLLSTLKSWLSSSKPNKEEQAKALEQAHKLLFLSLVDSTLFFLNLVKKYPKATRTAKQSEILKKYLTAGIKAAHVWKKQQAQLESIGIPKFNPKFFDATTVKELRAHADKIRGGATQPLNTLGFPFLIPLLWFAGVSVSGWALVKITDMLTTTTQEQEDLMKSTTATAQELGLSNEETKQLLLNNTAALDTNVLPKFGGGAIYMLGVAAFVYYLYTQSNKK